LYIAYYIKYNVLYVILYHMCIHILVVLSETAGVVIPNKDGNLSLILSE